MTLMRKTKVLRETCVCATVYTTMLMNKVLNMAWHLHSYNFHVTTQKPDPMTLLHICL
jgi:hypothetical protein